MCREKPTVFFLRSNGWNSSPFLQWENMCCENEYSWQISEKINSPAAAAAEGLPLLLSLSVSVRTQFVTFRPEKLFVYTTITTCPVLSASQSIDPLSEKNRDCFLRWCFLKKWNFKYILPLKRERVGLSVCLSSIAPLILSIRHSLRTAFSRGWFSYLPKIRMNIPRAQFNEPKKNVSFELSQLTWGLIFVVVCV